MHASHEQYGRARERLLAAQAELADASEGMQAAEKALGAEYQVAWDANVEAVQLALRQVQEASDALATVEGEVGEAARARWVAAGGIGICVLTDEELAHIDAAKDQVAAARKSHAEAQVAMKAGVTVEQLADAAERLADEAARD